MKTATVSKALVVVAAALINSGCATSGRAAKPLEPPFEWDPTFASPGTSLTLTKLQDTEVPISGSTYYQIEATGFSPDESLQFWTRSLDGEFSWLGGAVDADGLCQILGMDFYGVFNFSPGEPFDVALISETTGKRAHARAFPVPIEAQGTGGTSASAELALPTGRHFLITFRGFQPGEEVELTSRYETEVKTSSGMASPDGELTLAVEFGPGDHGEAIATASGKTGTVSLEYGIGMDAWRRKSLQSKARDAQ